MRKDVECKLGILKGRLIILKDGVRLHGVNAADKIWLTRCALHNWLLAIDGLSGELNGEMVLFDINPDAEEVPFLLRRLDTGDIIRNYDSSGMGPGFIGDEEDVTPDDENVPPIMEKMDADAQQGTPVSLATLNDIKYLNCDTMRY